jgi:hypothetical protein
VLDYRKKSWNLVQFINHEIAPNDSSLDYEFFIAKEEEISARENRSFLLVRL